MWEKQGEENKQEKNIIFPAGGKTAKPEKGGNLMLIQIICCAALLLLALLFVNINAGFKEDMSRYAHWMLEEGISLTSQEEIARFVNEVVEGIQKDCEGFSASLEQLRGDGTGQGGYFPLEDAHGMVAQEGKQNYVLSARLYIPLLKYTITSPYGQRQNPINEKMDFHTGIDLAAPLGTSVSAALNGVVIESGCNSVRGNYLFIRHDGGIVTQYNHLQYRFVHNGQSVRRGEVIATVGSTGMATGPHLHFELKLNGKYVNPLFAIQVGARV